MRDGAVQHMAADRAELSLLRRRSSCVVKTLWQPMSFADYRAVDHFAEVESVCHGAGSGRLEVYHPQGFDHGMQQILHFLMRRVRSVGTKHVFIAHRND